MMRRRRRPGVAHHGIKYGSSLMMRVVRGCIDIHGIPIGSILDTTNMYSGTYIPDVALYAT